MCGALRALPLSSSRHRDGRGESRGQVDDVAGNASYICVGCTRDGRIFVPLPPCRSQLAAKVAAQPAFHRPRRSRGGLVRIHICNASRRAAVNDTGRNFATMSTLGAPATFFPVEFPYGLSLHTIPFAEDRAPENTGI